VIALQVATMDGAECASAATFALPVLPIDLAGSQGS
jgi:hypothetical protein